MPAPPPSKKPVGRPLKPLSNEQINCMLEQNHDFEELKQWCEISDMKIANFYLHGEKINFDGNKHEIRKKVHQKNKARDPGALHAHAELCSYSQRIWSK